jgi:7,8-dihydroneopterin aldolase/epimerase/oxygenase
MGPIDGHPDVIEIRGLRVSGICGVLPEEQQRAQPLMIDLELVADLTAAGASDDLADTVDYASVAARVEELVATGRVALLEHLAARIAEVCLADARVTQATVHVRKLRPPVPQLLDTTGVRITRRR